jgi:mono/diheme cytochrome c family protein
MKTALIAFGLLAVMSSAACLQQEDIDPMTKQAKYKPFTQNPFFSDGRAMRTPPPNTVSRERTANPAVEYGTDEKGAPLAVSPLATTALLLATGHKQFNIHCAICHGGSGDGRSLVSSQMSLKTPPNLIAADKRALPDGRIFNSITNGYGLMNGYAADLTSEERWAVVAYLRALQRSQSTTMADAPADVQAQLQKEAQQ